MHRKESKPIDRSGNEHPQLLKRSSTRSYTKAFEQQKYNAQNRPSITDAFFNSGDAPELNELPMRNASYFMGGSKNANGPNQQPMGLQRNPSKISTKLEKNLSGIFGKSQQPFMQDDMQYCDAYGMP